MLDAIQTIGIVLTEAIFLYFVYGYIFNAVRPTVKSVITK